MSRSQATMLRAPQDSLAWKVVSFLEGNPCEELTRSDVAAKFDTDPAIVDPELRPACDSGHLVREQNDNGLVWRLNYSKRGHPKPFAPTLAAARKAARKQRKPYCFDVDALIIEKNVPLVENKLRESTWNKLFLRLEQGDSVAFPIEARDALAHAYHKYRSANPGTQYTVRKINETQCRIWRLQ